MIAIKLYSLLMVTTGTSVLHKEQDATHTHDPVTDCSINIASIFWYSYIS